MDSSRCNRCFSWFVRDRWAPIIRLNGNIARSNVILDRLEKELAAQKMDAKESHRRLWKHNDDQDERIGDHETRITILENRQEV